MAGVAEGLVVGFVPEARIVGAVHGDDVIDVRGGRHQAAALAIDAEGMLAQEPEAVALPARAVAALMGGLAQARYMVDSAVSRGLKRHSAGESNRPQAGLSNCCRQRTSTIQEFQSGADLLCGIPLAVENQLACRTIDTNRAIVPWAQSGRARV